MMSESDNNKDKFKKLKKDIEDSTQTLKDAKVFIDKTQNHIEVVSEGIDRAIWDGEYIIKSFDRFTKHPDILKDELFQDHLDYLHRELSGTIDLVKDFHSRVKNSYGDYSYISGEVSQTSLNMGTGAIGLYEFQNEFQKVNSIPSLDFSNEVFENPDENPYRKVKNLNIRLDGIHTSLTLKAEEISKSIAIMSKMKHLNNVAHQIREFISHFLQMCDPNNNVKTMDWVEFSNGKNPTQKSRCIYAIIGSKPKTAISQPIEAIAKKYRKLYTELNGLAHLREKYLSSKLIIQIKTYYKQFLDITEIILQLRELSNP